MKTTALIKSRRSVRRFKTCKISRRVLRQILEAGRWAPSGLNNQPWRFQIIRDPLQKGHLAHLSKDAQIIHKADTLIIVGLDAAHSYNREKDLMAIGACIQNMLLSAWEKRVGSCWLGEILSHKKSVASILQFPVGVELCAVIALGYPQCQRGVGQRQSVEDLMMRAI